MSSPPSISDSAIQADGRYQRAARLAVTRAFVLRSLTITVRATIASTRGAVIEGSHKLKHRLVAMRRVLLAGMCPGVEQR